MLRRCRILHAKSSFHLNTDGNREVTPALLDRLITIFRDMQQERESEGEHFRARAYSRVIGALSKARWANFKSSSSTPTKLYLKDLQEIEGIGPGMIERIVAVMNSPDGTLPEHVEAQARPTHRAAHFIATVNGFGPRKAVQLAHKHPEVSCIERLRELVATDPTSFTFAQRLGVQHYEDTMKRIPRAEVYRHRELLMAAVNRIDPALQLELCGSFRRGLITVGDIDCLLSWGPAASAEQVAAREFVSAKRIVVQQDSFGQAVVLPPPTAAGSICDVSPLHRLFELLQREKYIVASAACGDTKVMAYCSLPGGAVRRLDIRWVQPEAFPTALLYFTGSGMFNAHMRAAAISKGFTLNEYGLFPLTKHKQANRQKTKAGDAVDTATAKKSRSSAATAGRRGAVPVANERDVFDAIGLPYVDPEKRTDDFRFTLDGSV